MLAALMAGGTLLGGCGGGSSAASGPTDTNFLSELHDSAPDIGTYRTDNQLELLGHAVCDDFSAGASYETVADQLALQESNPALPTEDLGDVITAAADNFCPQFRNRVS